MRRRFLWQGVLFLFAASSAGAAFAIQMQRVQAYKSPTCGCCTLWVEHMRKSGFSVEAYDVRDVMPMRERFGVPDALASCHTSVVGGYVIEGHVPAEDIKRLLREKPKATGLTVPGMVQGSPGMEQGRGKEPYDVLLFGPGGRTTIFAKH